MPPDIRQLDQATVDRIAAGEVVERPASVVKELVENSVDAGASRVAVTVEAGGTDRIEVRDDGRGMTESEVRMAVREHTTSKIEDVADLEAGVETLGFRGEALHAIAAVSKLSVRTRKHGTDRGTELRVEGGEVTDVTTVGCPEGTTVEVRELFYNVPARRSYLKTEATEFSRISSVVAGYALATPDVAVSLAHGDRETFATSGRGDRRGAVLAVYGREVAENMVPVEGTDEEGPLAAVTGLVSHPETNRATREYVNTFVNGRWVTAGAVRDAVVKAYGSQLAGDRYPFAVLWLAVDPGTVDVNVHPRKLEVRFADEAGMRRQVRDAARGALLEAGLVRSTAPRGRSKADQTAIDPELADEETSAGSEVSEEEGGANAAAGGSANRDRSGGEMATDDGPGDETAIADATEGAPAGGAPGAASATDGAESAGGTGTTAGTGAADAAGSSCTAGSDAGEGWVPSVGAAGGSPERGRDDEGERSRRFGAPTAQTTFDGSDPTDRSFDALPSMHLLGQLHDTYVVAETDAGLLLVDQHAADERVHYERLRERFAGDVATQALAEPVELSVTATEAALVEASSEVLARLGFRTTLVDERTVRVATVPALLADVAGPEFVRDLVAAVADGDPDRTVERAVDDLLGDMACHPAITGNESLTDGTVVDLLAALDDCENPYACPHGRPVLVELARDELDDRFERDYPGHGG